MDLIVSGPDNEVEGGLQNRGRNDRVKLNL